MNKIYKMIMYLLSVLMPMYLTFESYMIIEKYAKESRLSMMFWVLMVFTVINALVYAIMAVVPFATAFIRDKHMRDDFRKSHGDTLINSSLIQKISVVPFMIILTIAAAIAISAVQKVTSMISMVLMLCMLPFAWVFALISVSVPAVGITVVIVIMTVVLNTSLVGITGEVAMMTCRKVKIVDCLIGILYMCFPLSDIAYIIISKVKKRYKISRLIINTICIFCLIIGVTATIALACACNKEMGGALIKF